MSTSSDSIRRAPLDDMAQPAPVWDVHAQDQVVPPP
jgi:hypothetical protein